MGARGRWLIGGLGVAAAVAGLAWFVLSATPVPKARVHGPSAPRAAKRARDADAAGPSAPGGTGQAPRPPAVAGADPRARKHVGLQLGSREEAGRRAKAQAIYDASLRELRRMAVLDEQRARDAYLRAHAALERVEDELGKDDEPGHARLRADIDALDAELRRLYGTPER